MIYEIQLWVFSFLKAIPGRIGCRLRNVLLPYKNGSKVLVWSHTHIDSPSKLTLGNNVSINRECVLHAGGEIEIGNDVLIGPGVTIYSQNHNFEDTSKNKLSSTQSLLSRTLTILFNKLISSGFC